ncbi:MAG: hypothetical protein SPG64_03690 [Candidatus Enteromonas sp.]|nr:hypothetical protein [Candidatus Enteromonas sp.]
MKDFKKILLVAATATLLSACGGNSKPVETSAPELGGSIYGGVIIDYTSDEHLLTAAVLGDYPGSFIYCPKVNQKVTVVPTFEGKYELDYITLDDVKVETKVGTADDKFTTYMGEVSLEGIRFAEFLMPDHAPTVKVVSKAAEGTTHKLTVTIADETEAVKYYDTTDSEWKFYTGSGIDSYFKTAGTHEVEILEGAMAGWLIQGADLENYHQGLYSYSATIDGARVPNNTLEASIDNIQKTTTFFKMPAKDVTAEVSMKNAALNGVAYDLVHGAGYVGKAVVNATKDYHGEVSVAGVELYEYCLPSYYTVSDEVKATLDETDYVVGKVNGHDGIVEQAWYKTVKFGSYTLTAAADAEGFLHYADAEGKNPLATEAGQAAWADAVIADEVVLALKAGNKKVGNAEFNKDNNGYGGTSFDWKGQRNATVAIAMDYGVDALLTAVYPKEADENGKKHWSITVDGETVVTAATWTDLNSDTTDKGYSSYAQLIKAAYDKALA